MEKKNKSGVRLAIIVIAILLGMVIPFVDYLVIFEIFYLFIPLAILFLASIVYLIGWLFLRGRNSNGLFLACIVPALCGSQLIATYAVDKIQRFRSERLIREMESTGETSAKTSADHGTLWGIEIVKVKKSDKFIISYSRGFMVREVYDSDANSWKSVGWND